MGSIAFATGTSNAVIPCGTKMEKEFSGQFDFNGDGSLDVVQLVTSSSEPNDYVEIFPGSTIIIGDVKSPDSYEFHSSPSNTFRQMLDGKAYNMLVVDADGDGDLDITYSVMDTVSSADSKKCMVGFRSLVNKLHVRVAANSTTPGNLKPPAVTVPPDNIQPNAPAPLEEKLETAPSVTGSLSPLLFRGKKGALPVCELAGLI